MGYFLSPHQVRVRIPLVVKKTPGQSLLRQNRGQGVTEYILLLAVISTAFALLSNGLNKMGVADKMTNMLLGPFAATYRYGHSKAKGYDDGGPSMHPMASGGNNFRIFIYTKQ